MTTESRDRPFRHYTLRHRITAWVSQTCFDGVTYTVRRGLIKGMRRRGGLGWLPFGPAMSAEELFWRGLDLDGMTVYDVGAFQGLLTLFFAARAERVIAFEPDSINHVRLLENLALNGMRNAQARKLAVGSEPGMLGMAHDPLMPGGSHLTEPGHGSLGVEVAALDDLELPPPDLIKIDTEGWELQALRGGERTICKHSPRLFLEMHGQTMAEKQRNATSIVAWLWEHGYRNNMHVESRAEITPENAVLASRGHLFCVR